jgi:hypothetical protein
MKNIILTFILLFSLTSCVDEKSREKLKDSYKICGGLTIEQYNVFGQGAFGADLFGEWLTDSVNFRTFIGTSDFQYTNIFVECIGDSIIITKRDEVKDVEKKIFSFSELKTLDNYND